MTKELIEEARRLARLTVARNWGNGGTTSYEDALREMCIRLADALEAATRVPVQGEPNDDREALFEARKAAVIDFPSAGDHVQYVAGYLRASRATVPDAATELQRAWIAEDRAKFDRADVEAERDAALAAVERARATAISIGLLGKLQPGDHSEILSAAVKDILAALDGAPEPEWEYGYELIEPDDRNVFEREGDFISAAFAYRAAKKRIHEEHDGNLPRLQYSIVRRRKAGTWESVEGESK